MLLQSFRLINRICPARPTPLGYFRGYSTATRRSAVATGTSTPGAPVIIYQTTRPSRPRLMLAVGITTALFFSNAALAVYELLDVTHTVPTSQLDSSKSPDSLAGRIPQFIRKGSPLPPDVQDHLQHNPPSPLRAWIAASGCLAVGAVALTFCIRYARGWVHSISLVYPPPPPPSAAAAAAKQQLQPVMAHVTYGPWAKSTKVVPVAQCFTTRPVSDMIRTERPFFYIKDQVDAPSNTANKESLMLTLDTSGHFVRKASSSGTTAVDHWFFQPSGQANITAAGTKK